MPGAIAPGVTLIVKNPNAPLTVEPAAGGEAEEQPASGGLGSRSPSATYEEPADYAMW